MSSHMSCLHTCFEWIIVQPSSVGRLMTTLEQFQTQWEQSQKPEGKVNSCIILKLPSHFHPRPAGRTKGCALHSSRVTLFHQVASLSFHRHLFCYKPLTWAFLLAVAPCCITGWYLFFPSFSVPPAFNSHCSFVTLSTPFSCGLCVPGLISADVE